MSDAYAIEVGDVPARNAPRAGDDFDLGSIGRAVRAKARPIIGLTGLALIASFLYVSLATPRYTGEAAILLESGDNFYTRPGSDRDPAVQPPPIDDQAVQSQVLLLSSRGLSIDAIRRLNLVGNAEFDPLAGPPQPWTRLLILAGLVQNPANLSPEDRVLEKFSDRLRVFPARGSRVINIEFTSADPQLAAEGANVMADLYLKVQEGAKKNSARSAGAWLSGAIQPLRQKVDEAEAKVEAFRAANGLLMGANNITINTQQLADLNTQLANARAVQADARSKAKLLRDMIQAGRLLDISEVANNELIRRLSEQRATLSAQMALEGRTLLPQHPRMKELVAQLADLDKQIRLAAEKTVRGLENDARIAGSRVDSVNAALDEQKKTSSLGNEKEIQLRALERDAKAARDQLEAYMAKFREASARDDDKAVPPDARIIARALAPSTASFPKKIPIISIATLATLVLSVAGVVATELAFPARGREPRLPDPARGARFGTRRVEPSAEAGQPSPETVMEGALAAMPAIAAFVEQQPSDPGGEAASPEEVAAQAPVEPEAGASERADPRLPETTEIAGIAAHIVSLKPQGRGVIVLLSRASVGDAAPSLALPLGRDVAASCRTVLVDLDRHADNLSRDTGLAEARGVSDLIANEIGFADAIHRDPSSSLHIVPAGVSPPQPDDQVGGRDLTVVLQALAQTYDAVLVDTRSIEEAATMRALIAAVDVTLIVRGEADEAAMAATLERFAAEKPALLLAVEPAANDDPAPPAEAAA
jgi:succinoglycan biosynthesis transport protein ExoP